MPYRGLTVALAAFLMASGAPGLPDSLIIPLDSTGTVADQRMRAANLDRSVRRPPERITIPGFSSDVSSGDPALPCKVIYIALPPDADEQTVQVVPDSYSTVTLDGAYDIPPVAPVAAAAQTLAWGRGKEIRNGRNTRVYSKNAFYPRRHLSVVNVGRLRSWKIAAVRFWPYAYNPVTRRLRAVTSAGASISYARAPSGTERVPDPAAAGMSDFVANRDQALEWYPTRQPTASAANYVIITTDEIASASATLAEFAQFLGLRGFTAMIATEGDWGGGTGDPAAENIRDWLADNYLALGIQYVLLIGNPSPSTGDVPMKMLWPRNNDSAYRDAPSDYYYCDLTGNWDLDGDGRAGEDPDDFDIGGVDRVPEVYVGRIPFYGNIADLDAILQKIMNYESTELGDWSRTILLSMKPLDGGTLAYQLGEEIRSDVALPLGLRAVRIYDDSYGLDPAPERYPCDYDAVQQAWREGAGLVFWMTHGSPSLACHILASTHCPYLDDARPSIVYQGSCYNGMPEDSNNLAYSLLRSGAVSTLSASRVSWYRIGERDYSCADSIGGLAYGYATYLLECGESTARAIMDARLSVPMNIWPNHLVFNLYGDPSLAYNNAFAGIVFGDVLTTEGSPIPGAVVRTGANDAGVVSQADGSYRLGGFTRDSTDIIVSAEGFHSQRFYGVPTARGSATRLDFRLCAAAPGTLMGRVLDVYGAPVYDATVTCDQIGRSTSSLHFGAFCFDNVPPGSYTLTVTKPPYARKIVFDCRVQDNKATEVDVVLTVRTGNLLANGGFEDGFTGAVGNCWQSFTTNGYSDSPLIGDDYHKYGAHSQKLHMRQTDSDAHCGVYQTVNVMPGTTYGLVGWQRKHFGDQETVTPEHIVGRIGCDPTGGNSYLSPTVVWHDFSPKTECWSSVFEDIVPYASTMTVFLDAWRKPPDREDDCYVWFDGIRLIGPVEAPQVPHVEVDSRYQTDTSRVRASWSCSDPEVVGYQYAVSRTTESSGIIPGGGWIGSGPRTSATRTGLALANGDTVRVLVRGINSSRVTSEIGASEQVRIIDDVEDVSAAKRTTDGTWVRIPDVRSTRMGEGCECFVEDPDGSAGIKASGDWSSIPYLSSGVRAAVVGRLTTQDDMRVITDAELMPWGVDTPSASIGMANYVVGGGDYHYVHGPPSSGQLGSEWGFGLNNVGLPVVVWGRVIGSAADTFTIHDGTLEDGLPITCHNSVAPPPLGAYVRVSGISTPHGVAVYGPGDIVTIVGRDYSDVGPDL